MLTLRFLNARHRMYSMSSDKSSQNYNVHILSLINRLTVLTSLRFYMTLHTMIALSYLGNLWQPEETPMKCPLLAKIVLHFIEELCNQNNFKALAGCSLYNTVAKPLSCDE